jgi:hypothetical protein
MDDFVAYEMTPTATKPMVTLPSTTPILIAVLRCMDHPVFG